MITISKMYSSLQKYEMDYYYEDKEPHIEFEGRLKDKLRLTGVGSDIFRKIFNGYNGDGAMIVRPGGNGKHNPGRDLVFSPDKSIAVACYLGGRPPDRIKIMNAHRNAVKTAVDYIERELIIERIYHGKNNVEHANSGNMLYLRFDHNLSRDLDPLLHTHTVVFNMTGSIAGGGKIKAMVNRNIYDGRKLLSCVYENELCRNLKSAGFDAFISKKGYACLHGFDNSIREVFSKRSRMMKDRMKGYFLSKGLNPDDEIGKGGLRKLEQAIMLYSRKRKKAVDLDEMIEKWKGELFSMGKSIHDIPVSKDMSLLNDKNTITPSECISMAVNAVTAEKGCFTKKDILIQALLISGPELDIKSLESAFGMSDLCKVSEMTRSGIGYHSVYTTREVIKLEKNNLDEAGNMQNDFRPEFGSAECFRRTLNYSFTVRQEREFTRILGSKNSLDIIAGYSNLSRYYLFGAIIRSFRDKGYDIVITVPDGKRIKKMEESYGLEVLTVDQFLSRGRPQNREKTLYIADRMDMVGTLKTGILMKMMKGPGNKIIFTGDANSHGMEAGRDFGNFHSTLNAGIDVHSIEKRTGDRRTALTDGDAAKLRESCRKKTELAVQRLDAGGGIVEGLNPAELKSSMIGEMLKDARGIIITGTNVLKNELNGLVRDELKKTGRITGEIKVLTVNEDIFGADTLRKRNAGYYEIGYLVTAGDGIKGMKKGEKGIVAGIDTAGNSVHLSVGESGMTAEINLDSCYKNIKVGDNREKSFGRGDRIIFLKTDESIGVKRGDRGTVEEIDCRGMKVSLKMNDPLQVSFGRYNNFDHAYAVTRLDDLTLRTNRVLCDLRGLQGTCLTDYNFTLREIQKGMKIYTEDKRLFTEKMKEIEFSKSLSDFFNNREKTLGSFRSLEKETGYAARERENSRGYERGITAGIGM